MFNFPRKITGRAKKSHHVGRCPIFPAKSSQEQKKVIMSADVQLSTIQWDDLSKIRKSTTSMRSLGNCFADPKETAVTSLRTTPLSASWCVVKGHAIGAGGFSLIPGPVKSDAVLPKGSPPLRCFFGAVLPRG